MQQIYKIIASFVHGNALGVVLEPISGEPTTEENWAQAFQVRIGPLVAEAAIGTEFPREDYEAVIRDLNKFCKKHGIERALGKEKPKAKAAA